MIKKLKFLAGMSLALIGTQAMALPIFSEGFESNLSKWLTPGSGQIVVDPLNSLNHVLNFASTASGGDIFTAKNLAGGAYYLSFDILGTCTNGKCGGFVGIDDGAGEHWLSGDTSYAAQSSVINNGTWQHIDFLFTATNTFRLKLEDFAWSGTAQDVYFDNICISSQAGDSACTTSRTTVPEPASLALLGLGLAGLGFSRRKKA